MRVRGQGERGYTLAELLVVIAVIAIMAFIAIPFMTSYMPSATVNYAAREVQQALNRAKLQAVATRQRVCVKATAAGYQFWTGVTAACAGGAVQVVTGSNATGTFPLANNIALALVTTNPVFNQFGVPDQTGQFRVTGTGGVSRTITVQGNGRVTIP
jgi:prepilin-type N-terminal cleavage/methylation domain-containing protein